LTPERIKAINNAVLGHVYNRTAVIAMVASSGPNRGVWGGGKYGVLQASHFLFLKPIDRTLFFCCQCVGAPTYQVEAAGPIAQFQAERLALELQQAPPRPWVEGPMRWFEGFFERGEDGPYDGEMKPFEDVGEPQPGVDYD
jgi:hypothetical protein